MAYLNTYAGTKREARGIASGSGAPSNGTSEVQTLTITGTPTGGTFKIQFRGRRTAAIAYNAAAAAVQAALEALPSLGSGQVTCGGGALPGTPVTITFAGTQAARAQPLATVVESALTGGTTPAAAITETTPGVTGTMRDAPIGAQYVRTSNGVLYVKTAASTWAVAGGQT